MRIVRKDNILAKKISLLLIFIPLIPVDGFYYICRPLYNILYTYAVLLVIAFIIVYMIFLNNKISLSKGTIILLGLIFYNIMNTVINHGDLIGVTVTWIYTAPLWLFMDIKRKQIKLCVETLLEYLEFILILNLILMFIFPEGMFQIGNELQGRIWILGYKSSLQYYVLPAIFFSTLLSVYNKRYFNLVLLLVISHLECVISSNSMLLSGLFLLDIAIFIKLYKKNIISKKTILVLTLFIVFLNIVITIYTSKFISMSYIQSYIMKFLHKDTTLSMRTTNWLAVTKAIKEKPLFGYGYTSQYVRTQLYNRTTAHAHNTFLELLYEGGFIQLIIFLYFNKLLVDKLFANKDSFSAKVTLIFVIIFYVMYIFENLFQKSSSLIWIIFFVGMLCGQVDEVLGKSKR